MVRKFTLILVLFSALFLSSRTAISQEIFALLHGKLRLVHEYFPDLNLSVSTPELSQNLNHFPILPREHSEIELPLLPEAQEYKVHHTVRRGETLGSIFADYGLLLKEAEIVQGELDLAAKSEKDLDRTIAPGQELTFEFSENGELDKFHADLRPDLRFSVRKDNSSQYAGNVELLPRKNLERVIIGSISSSFSEAIQRSGASYSVVDDFVDLFSDQVSFHKDFQPGDRFSIVYQDTILPDGSSLGSGVILAAALEAKGKTYFAIRFIGSDGQVRYFNEKGETHGDSFLRYPLKFSRISSYFSKSRFHPVLKTNRPHNGVDFAAPIGTPVRAVADGKVVTAGYHGGSGNMVKLEHGDRYATAYLHLSQISQEVRVGGVVKRGQIIGAVGMTGYATGPHLHFSFYDKGTYVDPLNIKLPMFQDLHESQRVDRVYLKRVLFTLEHYQRVESHDFYALSSKPNNFS